MAKLTDQNTHLIELNNAWSQIVDNINHELMTPLASIRLAIEQLNHQVNQQSVDSLKNSTDQSSIDLPTLEKISSLAQQSLSEIFNFIDKIRTYKKPLIENSTQQSKVNIVDIVTTVLNNYPFTDNQQALVSIENIAPYTLHCSPTFLASVFTSLIDNALMAITCKGSGEMTIYTQVSDDLYQIVIKNTGETISDYAKPRLFNSFLTEQGGELVPGLGYSRLGLLLLGAELSYAQSSTGENEFHIKFVNTGE